MIQEELEKETKLKDYIIPIDIVEDTVSSIVKEISIFLKRETTKSGDKLVDIIDYFLSEESLSPVIFIIHNIENYLLSRLQSFITLCTQIKKLPIVILMEIRRDTIIDNLISKKVSKINEIDYV
jgi:hypothetical protein